ncbi:MAG: hypothetical protein KOO62_08290 [candidate division Zixibacteria bacterium]|nr:hypothetical protein [candidate division Zixibacteria bacterium]
MKVQLFTLKNKGKKLHATLFIDESKVKCILAIKKELMSDAEFIARYGDDIEDVDPTTDPKRFLKAVLKKYDGTYFWAEEVK